MSAGKGPHRITRTEQFLVSVWSQAQRDERYAGAQAWDEASDVIHGARLYAIYTRRKRNGERGDQQLDDAYDLARARLRLAREARTP